MFVGITDETFNEESQMIYAYRTETGRRSANEDYCSIPAENEKPIAVVADGMGGHAREISRAALRLSRL